MLPTKTAPARFTTARENLWRRPFCGLRSWHGSSEPGACGPAAAPRPVSPRDHGRTAPAAVPARPSTWPPSCARGRCRQCASGSCVRRSTSQTTLQYQRPRASCEKLPDMNRPSISRCFHSRILRPRNSAIEPLISTSWFVNGIQPSERRGPRLTRQRSFGRRDLFPLVDELIDDLLDHLRGQTELPAGALRQIAQLPFRGPFRATARRPFADLVE